MADFDAIREVKHRAKERLFALPGVHCVAIGPKKTGGRVTEQTAIQVFVTKKKPLEELEPAEVIPTEIDGVKVDVIEAPMPHLLVDEKPYDNLCGGIQIQSGGDHRGEGTLGFIAQSSDGQKIYAVTNQHVMLVTQSQRAGVDAAANPKGFANSVDVDFNRSGFGAIEAGTVVGLRILGAPSGQGSLQRLAVVYATREGQHERDVAQAIRDEVNALNVVTATQSGSTVTIKPGASLAKIMVIPETFGQQITEDSGLTTSVAGNVISFSGQASDPGGAYVNFTLGGALPSFGVFVPIDAGDDAGKAATNTAAALTALKNSPRLSQQLTNINIQPSGSQVTVTGIDELECEITKDDRAGQPTNCFCCRHHKCCSNRIGRVVAVAMDVDAALIQLDGERTYVAKVEGIPENGGAVHGTTDAHVNDIVQKRGRTSEWTKGKVGALDAEGIIGLKSKDFPNPSFFHRYYRNAIRIDGDNGDDFSDSGDSGSAVMDQHNQIVGLLFGGGKGTGHGLATPIGEVIKAFAALNLVVATTTDPSKALTVPGPSYAFAALPADEAVSPITGGTSLWGSLHKAEVEIESIPAGKELSDAVRRNVNEGYRLVTTNKRVGAVWKRNGGQQIFPALMRLLQNPALRLPNEIGGKPLKECLTNIRRIFERYGSPAFIADLRQWGDGLIALMGLSYEEMKAALETAHQPT